MFSEVIVPVDGSNESARALGPAAAIARHREIPLRIVSYHADGEGFDLRRQMREQLLDIDPVRRTIETAKATKTVAEHIIEVVDHSPQALLVMSTHGHGRSGALIGSVATEVLEQTARPTLLIGPQCVTDRFRLEGPMIIASAGIEGSWEPTAAVASDFASTFDYEPWVVQVVDPETAGVLEAARSGGHGGDYVVESAGVSGRAAELEARLDRTVGFEVLHDRHPGEALAGYAADQEAAIVVMATAAGSGLKRLLKGSETADAVRHARCPVLAVGRP